METAPDYGRVNDLAVRAMKSSPHFWKTMIVICLVGTGLGLYAWLYQLKWGMEWGGMNHPINWGVYITNFVFWIGIAHAGTLISAILYLTRAKFRVSIYRISEAMTVFAVITAAFFPIIHLGRAWFAFWVLPYPNQRDLWVNFKSPLVWDAFAIGVYLFVSICFFYLGMLPDIASLRDESKGLKRAIYKLASFGFKGTSHQWLHYTRGYVLLAAIATPLVISVHSIVSWDFAVASIPGWHSTIFAPYFVIGAIFSGCALVILISVVLRNRFSPFREIIKIKDLETLSKLILAASILIGFVYLVEILLVFTHGSRAEQTLFYLRLFGQQGLLFWMMLILNCLLPQLLWLKSFRLNEKWLAIIGVSIGIGMWIERFVIITGPLSRGMDLFSWGNYSLGWVELWISCGSLCWFTLLLLLFIRLFPAVAISEFKQQLSFSENKRDE